MHPDGGATALDDLKLTDLTATEAAARLAAGEITSEALVQACLARVEALEPRVQAWAALDRELALERARAADAQRKAGQGVGPLHGLPVGLKDIIDTADLPAENGSAIFKGRRPRADAACVTALRRAGGLVLGKTVTTELATTTPAGTRNPLNLEHTPGGSSSGSAAAVAAGMVPAAVGTQTGGSVIRPAAFCGIYGFKPTFGVIPRSGVLMQSPTLDTLGVMGRSVEDVALLADALQAYDARDTASLSTSRPRFLATATADWPLPPAFTFVKTCAWGEAEPVTHAAFGELAEALGPQVNEINLDETTRAGLAAAKTIHDVELAAHYGALLDRAPELLSRGLAQRIEEGRKVRGVDYLAALAGRERAYATVEEVLVSYGPILTPAAPGPAPRDLGTTGNPVFCAFWTFLGVPAVTLPLLESGEGMPMGVQLIGARGDDGRLLRAARWLVRRLQEAE
jgi:Asp-tRNA(Asn)/Glu-tRNA(Gln) amidotransferase A subunit family amidase